MFQDMQDVIPACECAMCGLEIYPGEIVWNTEIGMIHTEAECVKAYLDEYVLDSKWNADFFMEKLGVPGGVA